jgi:hypothetical protein
MGNVKEFVKNSLGIVNNITDSVKSFMEYFLIEVNNLEFDTEPPYSKIQSKLSETLRDLGHDVVSLENFGLFSFNNTPKILKTQVNSLIPSAMIHEYFDEYDDILSDDLDDDLEVAKASETRCFRSSKAYKSNSTHHIK